MINKQEVIKEIRNCYIKVFGLAENEAIDRIHREIEQCMNTGIFKSEENAIVYLLYTSKIIYRQYFYMDADSDQEDVFEVTKPVNNIKRSRSFNDILRSL